ncbi:MAG: hypothetical protein AB7E15_09785 [Azospira sp.]
MKVLKDIDPKALDRLRQRLVGDNRVVNVGVPEGKREEDGTPVAMIAAVHEFGSPSQGIPERPFLRVAVQRNRQKYVRLNRINLVKMLRGQATIEQALGQLGEMAKGDVQTEIRSGVFTPLKEATKKRKGSSRPLIDTGQMVQSIAWELGDKNHD